MFVPLGKIKNLPDLVYCSWRLFKEHLHCAICYNGFSNILAQKVFDILCNGCEAEIVFSCPFNNTPQKLCRIGVLHHLPGLFCHQDAFLEVFFDSCPNKVEDTKHCERTEGVLQILDRESCKGVIDIDICLFVKNSDERASNEFFNSCRKIESFRYFHPD